MSEANRFAPKWNIFNHPKFSITGEEWKDHKGKPSLKYTVHENNPRFRLYMNDGKVEKPIAFALDPYILEDMFEVLEHVIQTKGPARFTMELKGTYDHRGQRTEKAAPISKIFIGRDSESCVYIAFCAKGEQIAKFPFAPSFWAELSDASGEKLAKELASEIRARSWKKTISQMTSMFLVVHGKEPAEKPGSFNQKKTGSWSKAPAETAASDDWDADVNF